jgi:hypothetical protein
VPAAAVIPAPIAYVKVVAVKKLVVGSRHPSAGRLNGRTGTTGVCFSLWRRLGGALHRVSPGAVRFTLKKLECSEQALHA